MAVHTISKHTQYKVDWNVSSLLIAEQTSLPITPRATLDEEVKNDHVVHQEIDALHF